MNKVWTVILALVAISAFAIFIDGGEKQNREKPSTIIELAYQGKASVKCEYILEGIDAKTSAYIKGEKLRLDTVDENNQHFDILYIGENSYFWQEETSKGFSFTGIKSEITEDGGLGVQSIEEIRSEIDKYKTFCREEDISDSEFQVPTGVDFQKFGI